MQQGWFKWMVCSVVFTGLVTLTGCEGGGDSGGSGAASDLPPAQVAGTWSGVFSYNVPAANQSGSQPAKFTISQNGNNLSGDIDGYAFTGTVNGNSLTFSAPTYSLQGLDVDVAASATFDGTAIVNFDGTAKAKKLGLTVASGTVHSDRLTKQ